MDLIKIGMFIAFLLSVFSFIRLIKLFSAVCLYSLSVRVQPDKSSLAVIFSCWHNGKIREVLSVKIAIATIGIVVFLLCLGVSCFTDKDAGYFECPHCKHSHLEIVFSLTFSFVASSS